MPDIIDGSKPEPPLPPHPWLRCSFLRITIKLPSFDDEKPLRSRTFSRTENASFNGNAFALVTVIGPVRAGSLMIVIPDVREYISRTKSTFAFLKSSFIFVLGLNLKLEIDESEDENCPPPTSNCPGEIAGKVSPQIRARAVI